jgi:hypothetical protein
MHCVCFLSKQIFAKILLVLFALARNTGSQSQFVVSAWKNEVAHTVASQHKLKAAGPTLDEITNRVFEELLQGKGAENSHASDHGSIKVQNLNKFSTFFAMH